MNGFKKTKKITLLNQELMKDQLKNIINSSGLDEGLGRVAVGENVYLHQLAFEYSLAKYSNYIMHQGQRLTS